MPVVVFSLLRLALFAACFVALWWIGLRSWLAAVVAAFLAWGLSYVLLSRQRDAAARHIAERVERGRRPDQDALVEDAADDAARKDG